MNKGAVLTTTEAADLAAVAPSTLKRWADQGLLPFSRTAGGHRRFDRFAVEQFLREQPGSPAADSPVAASWLHRLLGARRYEIDGGLLEARARLGSWCNVGEELALALAELGRQWKRGELSIAQEHVASDCLVRALGRVGDAMPMRVNGPTCLLASVAGDDHTIGLSIGDLCLREAGWTPLWLGRSTPAGEIVRLLREEGIASVALSASAVIEDEKQLRRIAGQVGSACKGARAGLVLAGAGAWPDKPTYGVRVASFPAFRDCIRQMEGGST